MLYLIELELTEMICYKELNISMKDSLERLVQGECGMETYQNAKRDIELITNVINQIEQIEKTI